MRPYDVVGFQIVEANPLDTKEISWVVVAPISIVQFSMYEFSEMLEVTSNIGSVTNEETLLLQCIIHSIYGCTTAPNPELGT